MRLARLHWAFRLQMRLARCNRLACRRPAHLDGLVGTVAGGLALTSSAGSTSSMLLRGRLLSARLPRSRRHGLRLRSSSLPSSSLPSSRRQARRLLSASLQSSRRSEAAAQRQVAEQQAAWEAAAQRQAAEQYMGMLSAVAILFDT